MKKQLLRLLFFVTGILLLFVIFRENRTPTPTNTADVNVEQSGFVPANDTGATNVPANGEQTSAVVLPIAGFFERVTKKSFGIFITPQTSPVHPERFSGYHAGADAETLPDEQELDVPVFAIADGMIVRTARANGYGGVILLRSTVGNETITVLYGHVRLSSVRFKTDDSVNKGDTLAVLGTGFSDETDGERKHLHFGVVRGDSTDVRGYVQTHKELDAWHDPMEWLKEHGAE